MQRVTVLLQQASGDSSLEKISLLISVSSIIIVFVLAVVLILTWIKMRKLNAKYSLFMKGKDGKDLESAIMTRVKDIDKMKSDIEYLIDKQNIICDTLLSTFQKFSIVKYDAFKEFGGKLSYSLALLDDKNNGFILTSMHTGEGCYTYAKEIIKGESYVVLSEEERRALEEAKNKRNYMVDK